MGSYQLITVPGYNCIIITSISVKGVVEVITVRDYCHNGGHIALWSEKADLSSSSLSSFLCLSSRLVVVVIIMAATR